jgi:hypothetical protein
MPIRRLFDVSKTPLKPGNDAHDEDKMPPDEPRTAKSLDAKAAKRAGDKLTLRLAPEVRETLEAIATEHRITMGEVIRQALSREKFLREEVQRGSSIFVEEKGGRLKQLVMY